MKSIKSKIPAIISMFIIIWVGVIWAVVMNPSSVDRGKGMALAVFALLLFLLAAILLFVDAILSVIKSFKGIDRIFNAILSLIIFCAFAFSLLVLCLSSFIGEWVVAVWNVFGIAIIVLEIISVVKHIKRAIQKMHAEENKLYNL